MRRVSTFIAALVVALSLGAACSSEDDPYHVLSASEMQYVIPDSGGWSSGELCGHHSGGSGGCGGPITVDRDRTRTTASRRGRTSGPMHLDRPVGGTQHVVDETYPSTGILSGCLDGVEPEPLAGQVMFGELLVELLLDLLTGTEDRCQRDDGSGVAGLQGADPTADRSARPADLDPVPIRHQVDEAVVTGRQFDV